MLNRDVQTQGFDLQIRRNAEDTAAIIGVSPETVSREWKLAKVWLLRELKRDSS
jgi:ECF sigma factor